ncbi:hypothetical protein P278_09200 [Zhouia amylolytica AD3]|uniref:Uncharacterized protein n=1 Tax=Zhouia amylolytica AD3 TaxID=1286632 RepID=W2UQB7_9FLAO|nr:hypothetical protein P278_09200 [Zhouia amylolytica AD3]
MEKVLILSGEILDAIDETKAESMPPDKKDPIGTSDLNRIFTASVKSS